MDPQVAHPERKQRLQERGHNEGLGQRVGRQGNGLFQNQVPV